MGAPDSDWGGRITVVEPNPGHTVAAEELIAFRREYLREGVRTSKQLVFVDSLPRSVNGKVLKKTFEHTSGLIPAGPLIGSDVAASRSMCCATTDLQSSGTT
ncbi:hypothetical protein CH267_00470 [Rhodococcus sp. 06-621-2]|nr:hypothetical protein CH267_00470 [Rhodococcus sp. 06-621-2]